MKSRGGIRSLVGPVVVAAAAVVALALNWRNGPDPVVDFGRELYLPWRLAEGEVLYRDLQHFNGPLSQYVNALLFKTFGTSLTTLLVANAALVLLLTAMIYALVRDVADDDVTATVAGVAFVTLFGCGNFTFVPNYNFLTPYSHELTHGVMLSVAAIACVARLARSEGRRVLAWAGGVGVFWGLIFLTKAEVFLAASIALTVGLVASVYTVRPRPREAFTWAGVVAACAAVPVVVAFALLWRAMPAREVLAGLAGSWKYLGDERLLSMPYFKDLDGTANVTASVLAIATMVVWYAAAVLVAGGLGMALRGKSGRVGLTAGAVAALVACAAIVGVGLHFPHDDLVRPLPLVLAVAGVAALVAVWRRRAGRHAVVVLSAVAFAACLLAKILLNVRVVHYGFALAMPGTIVLVVLTTGWLPDMVARRNGSALATRLVMAGVWLGVVVNFMWLESLISGTRTHVVAPDTPDAFRASVQGAMVDAAAKKVNSLATSPDQTVIGIPDGMMINYLARRVNPSGHMQFTPPGLVMFDEKRMLADVRAAPPEFIALVHADASTYGARFFGQDYGRELADWVKGNYEPVWQAGALPFSGDQFGILLMQRKPVGGVP